MLTETERVAHHLKDYRRRWHLAHAEQAKAYAMAWRLANPEQKKAAARAYRLANQSEICVWEQRRQARKRGLPNTLTASEWRAICAAYKFRCAYCGKKTKLTQDHVSPLSKGGGTTAWNTVPACPSCNSKKQNKAPSKPVNLALGM